MTSPWIAPTGLLTVECVVDGVSGSMMWSERNRGSSWTPSAMSRFWAMSMAAAVFLLPQALGLLCLLFPWLANALETSNILQPLAWWFQVRIEGGERSYELLAVVWQTTEGLGQGLRFKV